MLKGPSTMKKARRLAGTKAARAKIKKKIREALKKHAPELVDETLLGIARRTSGLIHPRRCRFLLALDAMIPHLKPDDMDKIEVILEHVAGRLHFQSLLDKMVA